MATGIVNLYRLRTKLENEESKVSAGGSENESRNSKIETIESFGLMSKR